MIIKSIQAKNHLLGWELEEIQFDTNPTLLVGLSGVGKTQILQSIYNLKRIIEGKSVNGFEWKIIFLIEEDEYVWEGKFSVIEEIHYISLREKKEEGNILFENLRLKDELIINRDVESIKFNDNLLPHLPDNQSLLFLLKKDIHIKNIVSGFRKIIMNDYTKKEIGEKSFDISLFNLEQKYKNIEIDLIKNSDEDILIKLYLAFASNLDVCHSIVRRILEAFPQLEDVRVAGKYKSVLENFMEITISIREKGVPREIEAKYISSGMLRTIIHIAQIYLANDGSVILIDEFENSLGTNCMDILTEDLIHENKNIQFITTSHHPYIINALPYQYWKIVTRKAGVISAKNASEYKLGKSKQKAFIQLTELLENQY